MGPTGRWIGPWWVFAFWLGPHSPPIQFGFTLAWGATHPPLPSYVSVRGVALLLYLALRVAVVSFVNRRLGREQEESAKAAEQSRILYEVHDTVKQSVHGISLILRAALEAERRGERDAVQEALEVQSPAEIAAAQRVFVEASATCAAAPRRSGPSST